MRARFERWQLDLRNGLRLFHAMDGWLPKEIEEHILQYLRHVGIYVLLVWLCMGANHDFN